jgi:hypothetical protein
VCGERKEKKKQRGSEKKWRGSLRGWEGAGPQLGFREGSVMWEGFSGCCFRDIRELLLQMNFNFKFNFVRFSGAAIIF